ncbi:MAG: class I SAM-dependent methyltransferase [Gammaproteobacteria bacterium]
MTDSNFIQSSYVQHASSYENYRDGQEKSDHAKTWMREDNVNAFRLKRVHALLDPWARLFPKSTWMTVGDGRYGSDAHYLKQKGLKALATDISDVLLKEGQALGYIDAYQRENAEQLSFKTDSFDFAFCKEAYHHFPRPVLALYEMLRISKKGVLLIEPIDREIVDWHQLLFLKLKDFLKRCLRKPVTKYFFEEDGNFLYALSKREIEKVALGLGLRQVVFKGINDIYLANMEYAPAVPSDPVFKKMRRKQWFYDFFSQLTLNPHNLLFAAILKEPLSQETVNQLTQEGFEVRNLPANPHIKLNDKHS